MPARLPSGTCTVARMYVSTCAFIRTHIVSTLYLRAGDDAYAQTYTHARIYMHERE
jgi:hypothetical protein